MINADASLWADTSLIGTARFAADIDLVLGGSEAPRNVDCGTYQAADGTTTNVTLTMIDRTAIVYDRRSGAIKGTRQFPAPTLHCAKEVVGEQTSTVSINEVKAWAATFVHTAGGGPAPVVKNLTGFDEF